MKINIRAENKFDMIAENDYEAIILTDFKEGKYRIVCTMSKPINDKHLVTTITYVR